MIFDTHIGGGASTLSASNFISSTVTAENSQTAGFFSSMLSSIKLKELVDGPEQPSDPSQRDKRTGAPLLADSMPAVDAAKEPVRSALSTHHSALGAHMPNIPGSLTVSSQVSTQQSRDNIAGSVAQPIVSGPPLPSIYKQQRAASKSSGLPKGVPQFVGAGSDTDVFVGLEDSARNTATAATANEFAGSVDHRGSPEDAGNLKVVPGFRHSSKSVMQDVVEEATQEAREVVAQIPVDQVTDAPPSLFVPGEMSQPTQFPTVTSYGGIVPSPNLSTPSETPHSARSSNAFFPYTAAPPAENKSTHATVATGPPSLSAHPPHPPLSRTSTHSAPPVSLGDKNVSRSLVAAVGISPAGDFPGSQSLPTRSGQFPPRSMNSMSAPPVPTSNASGLSPEPTVDDNKAGGPTTSGNKESEGKEGNKSAGSAKAKGSPSKKGIVGAVSVDAYSLVFTTELTHMYRSRRDF
jgi:hypothetical protein